MAPVLTQQYQLQNVGRGADPRSRSVHRSTPVPSNTPGGICDCGLCTQFVVLKGTRRILQGTENIYNVLLMNHSECMCVSVTYSGRTNPEGHLMLRDSGRTPKLLPLLPQSPHSQGQEWFGAGLRSLGMGQVTQSPIGSGFPFSRVKPGG